MPESYDTLFAKLAVHNKLLPLDRGQQCVKIQAALKQFGVAKTVADIAVEAGHIRRDQAARLIDGINAKFPIKHPALALVPSGAPRSYRLTLAQKAECQKIVEALKSLGYTRSLGDVIVDKGYAREMPPQSVPARTPGRSLGRPPLPSRRPEGDKKLRRPVVLIGAVAAVLIMGIAALLFWPKAPSQPERVAARPEPPKAVAAEKVEAPQPSEVKIEPVKPIESPPAEKVPDEDPIQATLARRRAEGLQKLEEVRSELRKDREELAKREAELEKRIAGRRLDVVLVGGRKYLSSAVQGFGPDELQIDTGTEKVTLPWGMVSPLSAYEAARIAYPAGQARNHFDLGRFLIARRMWKEAREEFGRAVSLDDTYESKVSEIREILDSVINGEFAVRGKMRQTGRQGILLSYSFQNPDEADDFVGHSDGEVHVESGVMTLRAKEKSAWMLKDLEFVDEMDIDLTVTATAALRFLFYISDETSYELVLGPDGCDLRKGTHQGKDKKIAKSDSAKLKEGMKHTVRLLVRGAAFKVFLDGKEAFAAEEIDENAKEGEKKPSRRGMFALGLKKGEAQFAAPLTVSGRMDPLDLQKRFAEVEILARRAAEGELDTLRESITEEKAYEILEGGDSRRWVNGLTVDALVLRYLNVGEDLPVYEKIRQSVGKLMDNYRLPDDEDPGSLLEDLIRKHPEFPGSYYFRALYKLNSHKGIDIGQAKSDLEQCVRLFPDFAEAHAQMALWWWYFNNDYPKAYQAAEEAVRNRPDWAMGHWLKGIFAAFPDLERSAEALESLDMALKLDERFRDVRDWRRAIVFEARGPRSLGCIYEAESEHYRVVTDISQEKAQEYADRLETAFGHYSDVFGKWISPRKRSKSRVAVFNTREAYYTYNELVDAEREESTLGLYRDYFNELLLFESPDLEESYHTLYHEAFHQFQFVMLDVQKQFAYHWYTEAMAEFMSAITIENKKLVRTEEILPKRLEEIQRILRGEFLIPAVSFEEMLRSFSSGYLAYNQGWSMLHFLYTYEKGKYRPLAEGFFEALKSGKNAAQATDEIFKGKTATLEREWRDYVLKLKK